MSRTPNVPPVSTPLPLPPHNEYPDVEAFGIIVTTLRKLKTDEDRMAVLRAANAYFNDRG